MGEINFDDWKHILEKRELMQKMKRLVVLIVLSGIIICACATNEDMESSNTTGSSIESNTTGSIATTSGAMTAITGVAVQAAGNGKIRTDGISTLRYANDKNIYLGDYGTKIYQYDLCGRRTKCYDLCTEMREKKADYSWTKVLWVDNDDVLFSCYRKKNQYEIWRVPLDRKKGSLRMDQKEKIAENMEEWDCLVIKTGEEIVYSADAKIYKVNLDTNQKEVLKIDTEKYFSLIMRDRQRLPFVQDNKIYYTDIDRVYQMDLGDWKPVYSGEKGGSYILWRPMGLTYIMNQRIISKTRKYMRIYIIVYIVQRKYW